MRRPRLSYPRAGSAVLCALLVLATPVLAGPSQDLRELQDLETAARQKSLALLSVLKSMEPEVSPGTETVPMGRIVTVSSQVREARSPESRGILQPNLNNEYEILDEDDNLVRIDLGDGRTGWIDESALQRFEQQRKTDELSFLGADPQQLRRYAIVIEELLAGIDEDMQSADALLSGLLPEKGESPLTGKNDRLRARGAHARIAEYQTYAHHFYQKYIVSYDFSLKNERAFLENLSAYADLLLGTSKFTTTTLVVRGTDRDQEKNEVDESLQQIELGGELDLNESSSLRASFSNKNEVNQTAYKTRTAGAGYARKWSDTTDLDFAVDTYSYTDDLNSENDFRRTKFSATSDKRGAGHDYHLDYGFTRKAFEEVASEDFDSHALDLSGRWTRGAGAQLRARLLGVFESSDADFHDFTHLTPSLEYSKRKGAGRTTWRGVYESLEYSEAALRSFGRAQLAYEKSYRDGPRRNRSAYALTHKNFPDNELATYAQLKAAWQRDKTGDATLRRSLTTYTNFYPDNSDNNYTDLRLNRSRTQDEHFFDLNVYSRLWHKPGESDSTSVAKPYVVDLYGRYGWVRGNLRFGPTVGVHLVAAKGSKVIQQDGNLIRVGFKAEGNFELPAKIHMTLDTSYDYGFVYTNQFDVDTGTGAITVDEVVQRHPTTFQLNAFASKPLGENFDLTSRLSMYRIATDMDETLSINPVTNNDRFTLFVGARYRHN